MFHVQIEKRVIWVAIGFAACWVLTRGEASAQSTTPALVVATNAIDAECVKRIGGDRVRVEVLLPDTGEPLADGYALCDRRALSLANYRLFVRRAGSCCPLEDLWHERMTNANPRGIVHRMASSRVSATSDRERGMLRASQVHEALSGALPEHRGLFDANLDLEKRRIHFGLETERFASQGRALAAHASTTGEAN